MPQDEQMGRGARMAFSDDDGEKYDALAVNIEDGTVRFFGQDKTRPDCEAIVAMAVMRRGCDEEFYVVVPHGRYAEGDVYDGTTR